MHADFLADVGGDELTDVTAATGGPAVTRLNELRDVAGDILQTIDPRNARQRRVEAALEFAVTFYAEGAVCQRELGSAFRDLRGPINGLNAWEPFELRNRAGLAGTHASRAEARWSAISTAGGRDRFRFVDAIDPDDYTAKMDQWDLAIDNVGDLVTFVDDFTEGNATLEDARSTYDEGNYQEAEDLAGQAAGAFAALQDAVDATSFTDGFVELADAFDRRLPAYRREAEELRTDAIVAQV